MRHTLFNPDLADKLCQRLADGESLREICRDEDMPNKASVFKWLRENEKFSDQYARAREEQAATYADDIVTIADTDEDPQRARIRIDARKWHASKLAPKKYGDRVVQEHTGSDGGPIKIEKSRSQVENEVDELLRG